MIDPDKCKGCLDWLHICEAECCKTFKIIFLNPEALSENMTEVVIRKALSKDYVRYYELHGCKYNRRTQRLTIPLKKFFIEGASMEIFNDCTKLTPEGLCSLHGTDEQPSVCHTPNIKEYKDLKGKYFTPRCLFKLKK